MWILHIRFGQICGFKCRENLHFCRRCVEKISTNKPKNVKKTTLNSMGGTSILINNLFRLSPKILLVEQLVGWKYPWPSRRSNIMNVVDRFSKVSNLNNFNARDAFPKDLIRTTLTANYLLVSYQRNDIEFCHLFSARANNILLVWMGHTNLTDKDWKKLTSKMLRSFPAYL